MAEELSEKIKEAVEHAEHQASGLGNTIAILVALAATFVALVSVKDRNITLRMDQAQAKAIDTWNYYQAKSMKQNLSEATLDQLTAVRGSAATASPDLEKRIANYEKQVARYEHEKGEVKEEAEGYEKKYEELNGRHDLFDLCDAAMSVAIALLGVTALTRKRWLLGVAAVFLLTGAFFGIAGFVNLPIHPETAVKWLA
jgi:chromosome segregation ATPase